MKDPCTHELRHLLPLSKTHISLSIFTLPIVVVSYDWRSFKRIHHRKVHLPVSLKVSRWLSFKIKKQEISITNIRSGT